MTYLILFLLITFSGFVQASSGTPCTTSSDCHSDECCVSLNQPRGKRTLTSHSLTATAPGTCHKMGTGGSRCLANLHFTSPVNGLYYTCPCSASYYCKGTGLYEVPLGEIGTCHANFTTVSSHFSHTLNLPCSHGSQCATSECCVSHIRPIGKRASLGGHCKPMGTAGSGCYVMAGSGKPDHMTYGCPCSSGLTCHGSGRYDIPIGETGICQ